MALPPHWMDNVIAAAVSSGDPTQIARAIATSPQFMNAIVDVLNNPPPTHTPGGQAIMGPGLVQTIRQSVIQAVATP